MPDRYVDLAYSVSGHFHSGHHLPLYVGKCANPHGHTWYVTVEIAFRNVPVGELEECYDGMLIDFGHVEEIWDWPNLDHGDLNNVIANPTAELIGIYIYDRVMHLIRESCDYTCKVVVNVMESEGKAVAITADEVPPSIESQLGEAMAQAEEQIRLELAQQEAGLVQAAMRIRPIKVD